MNQNPRSKEIEEITKAIRELSFYHRKTGEAINRLERDLEKIRSSGPTPRITKTVSETKVTLEDCKRLIGKNVRIINPTKGEGNFGHITSVGDLYVTVLLEEGIPKRRIARNLRLLHHESD